MVVRQTDLLGQIIRTAKGHSWLKGICCEPCYNAKHDKCRCRCHGAYHGKGKIAKEGVGNDKLLPQNEADKFRKLYTNPKCACDQDLSYEPIMYYIPHPDGWTIQCEKEKAWLFVHCPKCNSDISLWKLGVPREEIQTLPMKGSV